MHAKGCAWPVDSCPWPSWEQKSRSKSGSWCVLVQVFVQTQPERLVLLNICMCLSLSAFYFTSAFVCVSYEMQVFHITSREIKFTLMATIILNYAESIWQKEQHVQTGSL